MKPEGYTSRIERLRRKLYSRSRKPETSPERPLRPKNFDVSTDWERPEGAEERETNEALKVYQTELNMSKKGSFLNKALVISIIFFVLAGIYAVVSFSGGGGVISSKNIDIVVSGPISIAAGDVLSLQVDVRNKNNVELELTDLLVEYPNGTRQADNIGKELKRYRESLGNIPAGKNSELVIESVLFGEEGEKKIIKIGVEYRVLGSNAIFFTEREYQVGIVSSPISMEIDSPTNISSGQEVEFVVKVSANSSNKVNNVLFVADYPFGFQFNSANITPSFDDNVWELGDFQPGSAKTVRIRGILLGQDAEERTFRFEVGIPAEFDEKIIGTPFLTYSSSLVIQRPFVSLNVALNGDTSEEYVWEVGRVIRGDISWKNNLSSKVSNVLIEIAFSGSILNRSSVSAGKGFFRSTDNTIVWDGRSVPQLLSLGAGEEGSTSFSFSSRDISELAGQNINPDIALVARVTGDSFDESGIPRKIITTTERTVYISSSVDLGARAVYFSGPFINNGPIPPKANSETTYTIIFSISNLLNDLTGTKVTATLPAYVRWMGVTSPSNEGVSYNPVGGEITWNAGNVSGGTGYNSPSKELAFQVAVTPSISQIGSFPDIVTNIELEAQDTKTDARITDTQRAINTGLTSGSQSSNLQGMVVGD